MDSFFELLQISLGNRQAFSCVPSSKDWEKLYDIAEEQAILGVMFDGLEMLPPEQLPSSSVKLRWIGMAQLLEKSNREMDSAVVDLCEKMDFEEIRMMVFKGQTLAALYPNQRRRQSGDIDYFIWNKDWQKAIERLDRLYRDGDITNYIDDTTEKDVQYKYNGIAYEMHKMMVSLAAPKHRRYWENIVMPEILSQPWFVKIDGFDVPTMAPVYNILYVSAHIFEHLLLDGIGLRQFCDLYYLIKTYTLSGSERQQLKTHLEGLGLEKAFTGICSILTDYLGMDINQIPLPLTDYDHKNAPALMSNILKMGNFGHNKLYQSNGSLSHGIEHVRRVIAQVRLFGHYAPSEAWWRIPYMTQWRVKRALRSLYDNRKYTKQSKQ